MPLNVDSLLEKLKTDVGDPQIRVVNLTQNRQLLCRESDEELVQMLTARYAPGEPYQVVGF